MPSATHSTSSSSAAATVVDDSHEGIHLLVLQHGMWGYASHVKFIETQFKQHLGDRLCVYRARANESKYTYDGIDLCGVRLAEEIHAVIKVIEEGGSIEDMKGQKKKSPKKSSQPPLSAAPAPATSSSSSFSSSHPSTSTSSTTSLRSTTRPRKVTQFSYLGYSLGGLIGRFAIGVLETQKFFSPVSEGGRGVEPVYFITMATPHLGIRTPSQSNYSRLYNYLSARILSRTGEQLQLTDTYLPEDDVEDEDDREDRPSSSSSLPSPSPSSPQRQQSSKKQSPGSSSGGVPLLVAMAEPGSIFLQALARFKKRALYCNIRNDRSVPFWSGSFSDADPFQDLDTLNIQYHSKYSSLIESFEHLEQALQSGHAGSSNSDSDSDSDYEETVAGDVRGSKTSSLAATTTTQRSKNNKQQQQQEQSGTSRQKKGKKDSNKKKSWHGQLMERLKAVPWRRYFIIGVVVPVALPFWIIIFTSAVSYQGMGSRFRIRSLFKDPAKIQELETIRQSVLKARQERRRREREQSSRKQQKSTQLPAGGTNQSESTQTLLPTVAVVDVDQDCGVVIEQQPQKQPDQQHLEQQQQEGPSVEQDATGLAGEATATTTITTKSATTTKTAEAAKAGCHQDTLGSTITLGESEEVEEEEEEEEEGAPCCYRHLKTTIRPLNLLPAQKEISRHLNEVEWVKNILHIDAFNAHASIVVREKRFTHDGGVAAVKHVVDMFNQDGEDE
ncbi:hypothetical protein DFQ26_000105 [Actinomortierella ambigua]|nr:hypothetical protein DFQ26_000105 [Actinomortierella ambigua]